MACTTILVGKKATVDGSTLVARNEDFGAAYNPKRFVVVTPDQQPVHYQSVGTKLKIELPDNPVKYTALPCAEPEKDGIWGEAGINAHNVSMSSTETSTVNGEVLGIDPLVPGGIGEEDMLTIVLPYIHSARDGVKRLGSLLEKYGTYESNGIGFGDQDEVWYMETVGGHHWVAQRVPDDSYVAAANWFTITDFDFDSNDTMASADLQELIDSHDMNEDRSGKYNLRHILGTHNDTDYGWNIPREWYIQHIFNPSEDIQPDDPDLPFAKRPEKLIKIDDVKYALGSHYQHTKYDPYGQDTEVNKHKFRPIGIQRNQELHILQIRNHVDPSYAGLCWLAFGPNPYNGIAPFYTNITDTPSHYRDNSKKFDINSMYWLTHNMATIGDDHYRRYYAQLEFLDRDTLAAGRQVINATDAKLQSMTDEAAKEDLMTKANDETSNRAYNRAMKCLGDMIQRGSLQMKLSYLPL